MMIRHAAATAVALATLAAGAPSAWAITSPQRSYSDVEQSLCQPDVFRLCNDYVPDEERIIACMKANRRSLSPECRKVFDEGLKKRGK